MYVILILGHRNLGHEVTRSKSQKVKKKSEIAKRFLTSLWVQPYIKFWHSGYWSGRYSPYKFVLQSDLPKVPEAITRWPFLPDGWDCHSRPSLRGQYLIWKNAERFLVEFGFQKSENMFQVSIFFGIHPYLTLKFSCAKPMALYGAMSSWRIKLFFGPKKPVV